MNYLNNVKKKIEGDKIAGILLYHKYSCFFDYIDKKDYSETIKAVINDFKLHRIKNIVEGKLYGKKKKAINILGVGGYGQVYKLDDNYCIKINITNSQNYHEYFIPEKISELSDDIKNMILKPIALIKKSELKGLIHIIKMNIMLIYVLYCYILDVSISEVKIIQILKDLKIDTEYKEVFKVNKTKHLNYFYNLYYYYLDKYANVDIVTNILSIIRTLKNKNNEIINTGFMIIMPLAITTSYKLYLNPITKSVSKSGIKAYKIFNNIYRIVFLQVALFILNVRKSCKFCHNDLKPDNILISQSFENYAIKYENLEFFFIEKFKYKIADFDFSIIHDLVNNRKIMNTKLVNNTSWFTDVHYFIHKLFYFISNDEILADNDFFIELHKVFIYPFCNVPYDKMDKNLILRKDGIEICREGMYLMQIDIDIELLKNFISTDFFKNWRNDNGNFYKQQNSSNKDKNLSGISLENVSISDSSLYF